MFKGDLHEGAQPARQCPIWLGGVIWEHVVMDFFVGGGHRMNTIRVWEHNVKLSS